MMSEQVFGLRRGAGRAAPAIHPVLPTPEPMATLLGLAAAQAEGMEVEPFLIGGNLGLYGEPSRPFFLIGLTPTAQLVLGASAGGRRGDFPWQDGASSFLESISTFLATDRRHPAGVTLGGTQVNFGAGAVVGWIGHELPSTRLSRHDTVLFIDRSVGRAWAIASLRGDLRPQEAMREAQDRARRLAAKCSEAASLGAAMLRERPPPALSKPGQSMPAQGDPPPSWMPISPERHCHRVEQAMEQIAAGEVYQVNLSHPIHLPLRTRDPLGLARIFVDMTQLNPVPFPAFVTVAGTTVLALSPERYAARRGDQLESRPIKGTRPRGRNASEDCKLASVLAVSKKDRAENVMIVDLVRNDLGRVARTGEVKVKALCQVESFASVHHLVSTVWARLRPGASVAEILAAVHPPGSMTGAPKIRAVELLSLLEEEPRGPYAGGIGWFTSGGDFDLAMVIRSMVVEGGRAVLRVGGGIVADSDPMDEYRETLDKARSLVAVFDQRESPASMMTR